MGMLKDWMDRLTVSVAPGHVYRVAPYHKGRMKCVCMETPDGDVFDGAFSYRRRYDGGGYESARGTFDHDMKTGEWQFEMKGRERYRQLRAQFRRGVVSGEMEYTCRGGGFHGQDRLRWLLNVEEGVVKGKFVGEMNGNSFTGYCGEDGLPDGRWRLVVKGAGGAETLLCEVWDHGRLVEAYEETKGEPVAPASGGSGAKAGQTDAVGGPIGTVAGQSDAVAGQAATVGGPIGTAAGQPGKVARNVGLMNRLNFVLMEDCCPLLFLVQRGTAAAPLLRVLP